MIQHIERLYRCMLYALGRGRIKYIDDSGPVQKAQVQFGDSEIIDDLPVPHDFGFTSNPPVESDAAAAFMGGNRKNGVVVAVGNQEYRKRNLKPGETAVYDIRGQTVYLSEEGIIIDGAGLPLTIQNTPGVRMDTPLLEVTGNIKDNCDATSGKTMAQMRSTYNGHTHNDPQGGAVGTPNQPM
jgi:phage baseplate assembly protein V